MKFFVFILGIMALELLSCTSAKATTNIVSIEVKESSGITRTGEYVRRGVSLPIDSGAVNTSEMYISSDEAGNNLIDAQFHVISRWDVNSNGADSSDPIRVVLCIFSASVSANGTTTYYLHTKGGSGTVSGADIASDQKTYLNLNSGVVDIHIKKTAGFNVFDQVTVDGVNLVFSPTSDGIIIIKDGVTYSSYNSNNAPVVSIFYNGPLMACVTAEGDLQDSGNHVLIPDGGNTAIKYKVFYWIYKNERIIRPVVTIKNENNGYSTSASYELQHPLYFTSAFVRTTMSGMGNPTAVRFGPGVVSGGAFSALSPAGAYSIYMDHPEYNNDKITADDFSVMSYRVGASGFENVNLSDRFDSYSQLRDVNRGIMVASRWFWQNYWKQIVLNANNKQVDFYLYPAKSETNFIISGSWKTHELMYDFHANVPSSYDFSKELASLKNSLRAYPSTEFTSDYFYKVPPLNVSDPTIFNSNPNEKMQAAIDYFNKWMGAYFHGELADSHLYGHDIDDIRQNRPWKWSVGQWNGNYANMYGSLDFGDLSRGPSYGPGSQNYDWIWSEVFYGNRNKDSLVLDIADQFARHYGDLLIIHYPGAKTNLFAGSGITQADAHGGQRAEWGAWGLAPDLSTSANGGNEPGDFGHMWSSGFFWTYLLYGDPWILDVANHIADHAVYRVSNISRHATNPVSSRYCNVASCYSNTPETRMYSRAIPILVDLWKILGDVQYLRLAANVFENGILNNEKQVSGSRKGYMYFGAPSDAWIGYDAFLTTDLIQLWRALKESGDTTRSNEVALFLARQGDWVKNYLYNKSPEDYCGEYDGNGNYFPYQVGQGYWENSGLATTGSDDGSYSQSFSQTFAFLFEQTHDITWLNLARSVWKDAYAYHLSPGAPLSNHTWAPIQISDPLPLRGLSALPGTAWLKQAKQFQGSAYFLAVDYDYLSVLDTVSPASPTALSVW